MKSFIRLTDYKKSELLKIFQIADTVEKYNGILQGKTIVMFFPASSIRTRVSFEKGIYLLGGQTILFDPATLDKKEDIRDVCGYLQNWADAVIVRHRDISLLEKMVGMMSIPVINAMTDVNHPCEMMSDLYTLSKIRPDYLKDQYLFVGADGNIGRAWKEAAGAFGFHFTQSSPRAYQIPGVSCNENLKEAIVGKDIICTDSIPSSMIDDFKDYQISKELMSMANENAILNPCPPFYKGEEVTEDVINSDYFVGYEFKKSLLTIQQAILIYCLSECMEQI
ncbi:ornithine carbamoyltransferase [Lachnospiraceae bacterium KHCPX20]|nr:ornithine carbamoyltransferase [Lachnospiraceae bacterium KHCPX20]